MDFKAFSRRFRDSSAVHFPWMTLGMDEAVLSDFMFSPEVVELPRAIFFRVQHLVSFFHRLSQTSDYVAQVNTRVPPIAQLQRREHSVLMSYDFHFNLESAGLIEINTNASGFPLMLALNQYAGTFVSWPTFEPRTGTDLGAACAADLYQTFCDEYRAWSSRQGELRRVVIADEQAEQQRTYFEFLMYRELFRAQGLRSDIKSTDQLAIDDFKPGTLIYNRDTDFYMMNAGMTQLRHAYEQDAVCVSPNPRMYALLADKERALAWNEPLAQDIESRTLVPSLVVLTEDNRAQLWSERKHLFFKPIRSFGAKAAYRGSSVSHKVFNQMPAHETVAQGFVDPGVHAGRDIDGSFKFDVRFYVYQDRIQGVVARLYQGQLTNFRTLGGGFAAVRFI